MTRAKILSLLAITAAACGDDPPPGMDPDAGPNISVHAVQADITTNTTWTADGMPYILKKQIFVKTGATLTIMPGVEVQGEQGTGLVITRGATIMATGTADKPIVFTSAQPSGSRTPGFWGGLTILGNAPVNVNRATGDNTAQFEAIPASNADGRFGGTDANDNSGVLKYVRVEFAGFEFAPDKEYNNLTLCGVGARTTIDFVQVHRGSDDGVEFFGGTVNIKHFVSSQNEDDGFDTDNGWQGKVQFLIVQDVTHPATIGDATNGYESDNHANSASYTQDPRTLPTVSNVTLIGDHDYTGNKNFAAVFRRGTGGHYMNHIWLDFGIGPEMRDDATEQQAIAGNLTVTYSMFFGNDKTASQLPAAQPTGDIDESLYLTTTATDDPHNVFDTDPGLTDPTNKTAPNFKPKAGAAALTAGTTPPGDPFFDATATFAGAIGGDDWTAGWASYPQK